MCAIFPETIGQIQRRPSSPKGLADIKVIKIGDISEAESSDKDLFISEPSGISQDVPPPLLAFSRARLPYATTCLQGGYVDPVLTCP